MTDDMMTLRTLLEKSSDADLLREMIGLTTELKVDPVGPQGPPCCFASRNAKRYTKQRGSLLWTTGATRKAAHHIKQGKLNLLRPNDALLLRPAMYF